jgi:hypothetical protein
VPPAAAKVNVEAARVDELIASLKVAVTFGAVTDTPVALLVGVVELTVGAGAAPVVKLHV